MTVDYSGLPAHWTVSRVDRVASVNARIGWKALTAAEYQLDGYAFLATPNIKSESIDFDNVNYISKFRYDESPELQLAVGDVLLAKDGNTLGICNVVRTLPRPATVNGSIAVLRPRCIEPRYLRYCLASSVVQEHINTVKDGMGVPHLFQRDIKRIPIPLPPIDEQRRIADFLDAETARIDRPCELSRQQAAVLLERLVVDMRGIVTGATNEPAPTGIPWMPYISAEWRLGKIAHLFRTGSGTTPSAGNSAYFDGDLPWINSADIHGGIVTDSSRHITWQAVRDFPSLRKHPKGSLVLAMYGQGETKGRVAILGIDAYVNQACCVMSPLGNLSAEFAYFWFRAFKEGVVSLAFGAGQPNLSQDLIRGIRVPVPDPPSQVSIVHRLRELERHVTNQREALNRRTELLQERRQALITAAVTGQLGVATARGADLSCICSS